MKSREILVDYLNLYTVIYIVFFRYTSISLIYKHKFLNNFYLYFLIKLDIKIKYLKIKYSSSDYKQYRDIAVQKDYLTSKKFISNNFIGNYIYKSYFYERIHPLVELEVFFSHLKFYV